MNLAIPRELHEFLQYVDGMAVFIFVYVFTENPFPSRSSIRPGHVPTADALRDARATCEDNELPRGNLVTAVVRLEKSRSPGDLVRVVEALQRWRQSPRDYELMRVFVDWVLRLTERFIPNKEEALPPVRTLEGVTMTLEERVSQWPAQWIREGMEQGREQGLAQGLKQGLEHEQALLRRMAASRFGETTAERLSETLVHITDPERLADISDRLVRCDTEEEFLDCVSSASIEIEPPGERGASRV